MNPLRKFIQNFGFDFHRYIPKIDYWIFLKSLNINTILDIGANIGQFAIEARTKSPDSQIYSFEPLKECFKKLEKKFEKDKKFKAFNYALGNNTIITEMHKSAYSPSSS